MTTAMQPTMFDVQPNPRHPAKYSDALLPVFVEMLRGCTRILDPFGGTGKIFMLEPFLPGAEIHAIELESEWATMHPRTTVGNALALPWPDNHFDGICTSPTYGNRMADIYTDGTPRNTYTAYLGRALHPDNSGQLQWGDKYRAFHVAAWCEALRVLQPGGVFVLNIKDHIRAGKRQRVTGWHCETLEGLGMVETGREDIDCPGQRQGENGDLRIAYESVVRFVKP